MSSQFVIAGLGANLERGGSVDLITFQGILTKVNLEIMYFNVQYTIYYYANVETFSDV